MLYIVNIFLSGMILLVKMYNKTPFLLCKILFKKCLQSYNICCTINISNEREVNNMKYAIYRIDSTKIFTHAYGNTKEVESSTAKGLTIVGYANTKKEASAKVKELGQWILK